MQISRFCFMDLSSNEKQANRAREPVLSHFGPVLDLVLKLETHCFLRYIPIA